ncbi:MAG: cell division protein FtsL [Roseinatronobacter sp.]
MRSLLYLLTALGVIALAAWAYRENHLTRQAINERAALAREIASLEQAIGIQRAEWAFLNRPDRLQELVDVNFQTLLLVPMTADHFGEIDLVVYPEPAPRPELLETEETFGTIQNTPAPMPTPDLSEEQLP